ncbi:MAG: Glycosyltransferase [Microgenomates group bacterium GW2011_GWA2_46_7]|nr:MAG: Glycosyltransferase [Microgenomates group bacterium GW2011_GWC2_46_7]KKU46736.1 MAG: Glycosyltransferase [Microgenomates group bacterium GW2011_GWA2_46_7]
MTTKLTSLSIFMPAYNEEGNIAATILDASRAAGSVTKDYEIIVVNDGSHDKTASIVTDLSKLDPHLRLLNHRLNRGYGAAVKTGMSACRKDWIFFTDSDGQFHYDELARFVEATNSADLVMGYRRKRMDPFHRVFVAQVLLKIWNFVLFGLTVRDVDCAYKLFSRQVRDAIKLKTESAITVSEFIIKAKAHGFRIIQLPVQHYARRFGEQTGGNWRVILRAARESFRLYQELHPTS